MIAVLDAITVARPGGRPRRRPDRVLADKTYSSRANRALLRRHGIRATIPVPADQAGHRAARGTRGGRPPAFDATRYDKVAVRYATTVHVAVINGWLKRLSYRNRP